MNKYTLLLFATLACTACGKENNPPTDPSVKNIVLTVSGTTFEATLGNTKAAQEFAAMLPLSLNMQELNGNEKYCNLSQKLTTDSQKPGTIHAGDIMLYGRDCIVVFYETFQTSYNYTPIGNITDPARLKETLGTGNITIKFTAQ